ncbi:MAG TPA: hypothetical protein VF310_04710, partial [Vicinamibacteria bacterium]
MSDAEARLNQLENEVAALKPSLAERLARLEAAAAQKPSTPKTPGGRLMAWMGAEAPKLLAAVVLLVITYWIKDSVDLALKRQQLQLAYTKEMQAHLEKMADPTSDREQIERAALLLAAYREFAITPLLNETRYEGLRANGAEAGLRFVALTEPEALCRILPRVLANRTRQFGWRSHLRVIRLLGESGCTAARPELERYRESVRTAGAGGTFELASDAPKPDELEQLQKALDHALTL